MSFEDKKLFTPGPLNVSSRVRNALCKDLGSRDVSFIDSVKWVRDKLVEVSGLSEKDYTAILMQGSGTFSIESVIRSTCESPSNDSKKILILVCGAYGKRMELICHRSGVDCDVLEFPENETIDIEKLTSVLRKSQCTDTDGNLKKFGAVALVHCETTSGIINPVSIIGQKIKEIDQNLIYIVDAMSSFGGIEADYSTVDFLISSANKCLQGIPGFGFVIARKTELLKCKERSRSLSLDLYEQWQGLESNGQFRFTPPTHSILGLMEALKELEDDDGGVCGRSKRYQENNRIVKEGMTQFGFSRFVDDKHDGHIITSFHFPKNPNFKFEDFYNRLSEKGQLIYPGKVTNADCFRIGNIGHLFPDDMRHLLECIKQVLQDMKIVI